MYTEKVMDHFMHPRNVGEIENPAYSRITISLSGDEYTKNQIVAQLHKLHNVQKVKVLFDESTLKRELMIIKMKNKFKAFQFKKQLRRYINIKHVFISIFYPDFYRFI